MADFGLKVSQDGYDVTTAPKTKMVMSSSFNLLKSKATGIAIGDFLHGLAYVPIFFTTRKTAAGRWSLVGDDYSTNCDSAELNMTAGRRFYIFYQQGI